MKKQIQEQCFPLSLSQQNIWNLECAFPGTSVNNISTTVRIRGQLDFPLLQESIHLVLENDASINTRIIEKDGERRSIMEVVGERVTFISSANRKNEESQDVEFIEE